MSSVASQPIRLIEPLISKLKSPFPIELNNNQVMDVDSKSSSTILSSKPKIPINKEIIENTEIIQENCSKTIDENDEDEEEEEKVPSSPDDNMQGPEIKRGRSMSDGFTSSSPEYFEVFPSLPDSVLEKMALLGDGPRERLNEEELEQKFLALALAFTIDAATIKDRCVRQRRFRDQTETNLVTEIERLVEKVNRLHPLCIDAETTELLTSLLNHVDIVLRASSLATISAERYGAVQHEDRLAESVSLMISHVTVLKQQRDSTRRQLQYTKRMLQDTNSVSEGSVSNNRNNSRNQATNGLTGSSNGIASGRVLTRRRASIATITQESCKTATSELRKITRRPSDLSLRGGAIIRPLKPTRLELGLDLVKIREGVREENHPPIVQEENESEPLNRIDDDDGFSDDHIISDSGINLSGKNSDENENAPDMGGIYPLRKRLRKRLLKLRRDSEGKLKTWLIGGTMNEIFCFCALMCFSISIIIMGNILVDLECSKRGRSFESIMWNFVPFSTNAKQIDYAATNT